MYVLAFEYFRLLEYSFKLGATLLGCDFFLDKLGFPLKETNFFCHLFKLFMLGFGLFLKLKLGCKQLITNSLGSSYSLLSLHLIDDLGLFKSCDSGNKCPCLQF